MSFKCPLPAHHVSTKTKGAVTPGATVESESNEETQSTSWWDTMKNTAKNACTAAADLAKSAANKVNDMWTGKETEVRRLADHARMEAKDVDSMSPSELVLHRRRLTYGVRVSPVLGALMDEIA